MYYKIYKIHHLMKIFLKIQIIHYHKIWLNNKIQWIQILYHHKKQNKENLLNNQVKVNLKKIKVFLKNKKLMKLNKILMLIIKVLLIHINKNIHNQEHFIIINNIHNQIIKFNNKESIQNLFKVLIIIIMIL